MMRSTLVSLSLTLLLCGAAGQASAAEPTLDEIIARTNHAAYYQGKDGRARVKMTITDKQGRKRERELTILRRNSDEKKDADQQYYVYFHGPADVAKTVFMVHKKVSGDDDRWLYLPGLDLVKRIAAADKRTSFVGSDFVYEDVSGRGLTEDTHKLTKTTKSYYVLEHVPRSRDKVNFARYVMYVHLTTFLPTKVEYYNDKGEIIRVMTVDKVEKIQGYPTPVRTTMEDRASGSKTTIEYSNIEYDLKLPDDIFTERYLRRAPIKFIK
ncbi:MAG TPA: outer membrane lipoprotein-sorting protein [Kofleriaceae bacterium]|nr:outer membrane lipoprotein-sorting protein [Kofleriaceae bacterium]